MHVTCAEVALWQLPLQSEPTQEQASFEPHAAGMGMHEYDGSRSQTEI
jgi:hypothetical protein